MKAKIKFLPVLIGFLFLFTYCEKGNDDSLNLTMGAKKDLHEGSCHVVQQLWAGAAKNDKSKGTLVGDVTAAIVDGNLVVHYKVNPPWILSETHLWVGTAIMDIPKQAAPGQFPFQHDLSGASEDMFTIPLADLGINPDEQKIYIAAHGVVSEGPGSASELCEYLPETVKFTIKFPGTSSYNIVNILGSSILTGTHDAWCVETDEGASQNEEYTADVYCSNETLPDGLVDYPENLDLVNWILNQDYIGTPSDCDGNYTRGDIQTAIWALLSAIPAAVDDQGPFSECRVNEIIADAQANGEGYEPGCGDLVLVLLFPEGKVQNIAFGFPVTCGAEETCWAFGDFEFDDYKISKKWGWMFSLDCTID